MIGAPLAAVASNPVTLMLSGAGSSGLSTPPITGSPVNAESKVLTVPCTGVAIPFSGPARIFVITDFGRLTPVQTPTSAACADDASKVEPMVANPARSRKLRPDAAARLFRLLSNMTVPLDMPSPDRCGRSSHLYDNTNTPKKQSTCNRYLNNIVKLNAILLSLQ